jgi:hypothetical protein
MVPAKCAFAWSQLITPPNQGAPRFPGFAVMGMEIGEAYTAAIENILMHPQLQNAQYLLTIEHDNIPQPDGLLRLLTHMEAHPELACIGGLYWTKGEGGVPQIWGDRSDPVPNFRPQPPSYELPDGKWSRGTPLVECWGTGMGFNLWRLPMFKDPRLRRPWFQTICSPEKGVGTQDLFAWADFQKNGYRCAIACDVKVGHYDVAGDKVW